VREDLINSHGSHFSDGVIRFFGRDMPSVEYSPCSWRSTFVFLTLNLHLVYFWHFVLYCLYAAILYRIAFLWLSSEVRRRSPFVKICSIDCSWTLFSKWKIRRVCLYKIFSRQTNTVTARFQKSRCHDTSLFASHFKTFYVLFRIDFAFANNYIRSPFAIIS